MVTYGKVNLIPKDQMSENKVIKACLGRRAGRRRAVHHAFHGVDIKRLLGIREVFPRELLESVRDSKKRMIRTSPGAARRFGIEQDEKH